MASFKALYGQKCRSPVCWTEVGERKLLGPKLVQLTTDKIKLVKQWLQIALSHHKSYTDVKRRPLEFDVSDWVFLKVSPSKGIIWFGR